MRESNRMDRHMYGDTGRGASGGVLRGTREKALTLAAVQEDNMWVVLQRLGVIQDTKLQAVCLYLVETCLMCYILHVSLQYILYADA